MLGPFTTDADARIADFRKALPAGRARRLTAMAVLLSEVLRRLPHEEDEPVYFGSTYGDTPSLEKYLASFPHASPMSFQNSIHPGPLVQAFVARGRPVPAFLPFAGGREIIGSLLLSAMTASAATRLCIVAETQATWMTQASIASGATFALGFRMTEAPRNPRFRVVRASGNVEASSIARESGANEGTEGFFQAMAEEVEFRVHSEAYGDFRFQRCCPGPI